jgi:hypothetical protein
VLLGYNIEPLRKEVPRPREAPAGLTTEQETTLRLASGLSASKLWVANPGGVLNSDKVADALKVGVWQGDIKLLEREQVRPRDVNVTVASTLPLKPECQCTAGCTEAASGGGGRAR